ncbi:MAG: hypothetical protein JW741_16630 [Sedimentisphaerales bacterium]|nr:hypothetical protein [Sedimentisphaerales bacterium]
MRSFGDVSRKCNLLVLSALLISLGSLRLARGATVDGGGADTFFVFSEFEIWADPAGPQIYRKLSQRYIATGHSSPFDMYPRYESLVWDLARAKCWVDEAAQLGGFNVFGISDRIRVADGHLFTRAGVNPKLEEVFFGVVSYAHQKGFLVAVEPANLPAVNTQASFAAWLKGWLGADVPAERRADVLKLNLDLFGGGEDNPDMAEAVEPFLLACRQVCPGTVICLTSSDISRDRPHPFYQWVLSRFPGTIISHYLNTDQIEPFRAAGARNMMVQINPCELFGPAGQYFIYHQETVTFLKNIRDKRVRYLSLAGVNMGYCRRNYDLFLDVVRPHLRLVRDIPELRRTVLRDEIVDPPTKEEVKAQMVAQNEERAAGAPCAKRGRRRNRSGQTEDAGSGFAFWRNALSHFGGWSLL